MSHLLTAKELSSFLNVHPKTVYKWASEGRLPFRKINGSIRFDKDEIEAFQKKYKPKKIYPPELIPKLDLTLVNYDKMFLKGGNCAVSNKKQRWNYGFGTVYIVKTKRGHKRWYIEYRDTTGRRIRRIVLHAQTREEALIELQSEVRNLFDEANGISRIKTKVKYCELAHQYLEDYAKVNNLAWKRVQSCLKQLTGFFGKYYLNSITPLLIEKYKQKRLSDGIMPASVNREMSVLKRSFNLAITWKMTKENPVKEVRFLRQPEPRERILEEDEEERLFEMSAAHLKPILLTALRTGMRKNEIVSLMWEQVNLRYKEIEVIKTKSGRKRIIPISDDLYDVLVSLYNRKKKSQFVFQYADPKTGELKHLTYFRRAFETACRRARIVGLTFHDLRHTFATRLVRSGVDLITVKDLLGHYSVRTTERYTHSNQEQKRKAVDLLGVQTSGKKSQKMVNLSSICHLEKEDILESLRNLSVFN